MLYTDKLPNGHCFKYITDENGKMVGGEEFDEHGHPVSTFSGLGNKRFPKLPGWASHQKRRDQEDKL